MKNTIATLLALALLVPVLAPNTSAEAKSYKGNVSANSGKIDPKRAKLLKNAVYQQGVKLFAQKNYAAALKCFYQVDASGLCCDMVHYYIGQCYQKTNQTAAAQQHYDWVLTRSKDPQLRAYADYGNQVMAYYSQHRTFAGQGNNFDRGGMGGSGSSGSRRTGFG